MENPAQSTPPTQQAPIQQPIPASKKPQILLLVLVAIIMLVIGMAGGYFIASSSKQITNKDYNSTTISPTVLPSIAPTVPTSANKIVSPPAEIKKEVITAQLKSIPLSSTDGWKTISFRGITFKIPTDLTFKDLEDSSQIGIIYKEGEPGGPRADIGVHDYKGGSRRVEFFGDHYSDCHYIYEEALFGKVKALQIAADLGYCEGGAGAIVTVSGNKLVSVGPSLQYNTETKEIYRYPLGDTIVSTISN